MTDIKAVDRRCETHFYGERVSPFTEAAASRVCLAASTHGRCGRVTTMTSGVPGEAGAGRRMQRGGRIVAVAALHASDGAMTRKRCGMRRARVE